MPYETPAALRQALETRLQNQARARGVEIAWLRRRTVFERTLVRLEKAGGGRWVLKGGMALELRLRGRARTTKDLDLVLREASADGEQVREVIVESLASDPDGDRFEFRLGPTQPLSVDEAGRPGWRFPLAAHLDSRLFANVRMDVVARTDEITATERVPLPGVLSFAEIPVTEVEVVGRAQHFAEKLHAYTRTYRDRPSSRVKDLPDLILLIEDGLQPSSELAATVDNLFTSRGTHPVPGDLPEPPAAWEPRYGELVEDLDLTPKTLDEAMHVLRDFWAATLACRTSET